MVVTNSYSPINMGVSATGTTTKIVIGDIMDSLDYLKILKKSMLSIADIPTKLIEELYGICRKRSFKKGQFFLRAGDYSEYVGFNVKGIFRLYYIDPNGNDWTKGFSTKGKFVISYSSIVQKRPSYFFIESITDSEILLFRYSDWKRMIDNNIEWYPFIFNLIQSIYIMKEMREKTFLMDDATQRYLNFLDEYPNLIDKVKLYYVASFLGISPETLSRIRKNIKN